MGVDPGWIAGRLRELRVAAGLTQQQLAEKVGVKREAIARWEKGDQEPGWSYVVALAEALGVTCEAFAQRPAIDEATETRKLGRPRKEADGQADEGSLEDGAPIKKRKAK